MKHKHASSRTLHTPDDSRDDDDDDDDENNEQGARKRTIQFDTFKKWQRDFDKELKSLTWLDCIIQTHVGKKTVVALRCSVCCRFKEGIENSSNFSDKWIVGADSLSTSNIRDHAKTIQHCMAMSLLEKEHAITRGDSLSTYAPIARAIEKIPITESARLRRKFDIAYLVATEKLSYLKYPSICELEKKHGVDIGVAYTNERSGKVFVVLYII